MDAYMLKSVLSVYGFSPHCHAKQAALQAVVWSFSKFISLCYVCMALYDNTLIHCLLPSLDVLGSAQLASVQECQWVVTSSANKLASRSVHAWAYVWTLNVRMV